MGKPSSTSDYATRPVIIDGEFREVPAHGSLAGIMPDDVMSVRTDQGALVTRDRFANTPIPDGFQANLSRINKGAAAPPGPRGPRRSAFGDEIDASFAELPVTRQG